MKAKCTIILERSRYGIYDQLVVANGIPLPALMDSQRGGGFFVLRSDMGKALRKLGHSNLAAKAEAVDGSSYYYYDLGEGVLQIPVDRNVIYDGPKTPKVPTSRGNDFTKE